MKNMRLLISLSFEPELFTWLCLLFSFQVSSLRPKRISILSECVCVCVCARARACAQSCPTLYGPMDCGPPASSVHGIFQARTLEWVAISFKKDALSPQGGGLTVLFLHHDYDYSEAFYRK